MNNYIEEYVFYNKYHTNVYNKIIHMIGIPFIVWSTFLFTHRFKILESRLSSIIYLFYFNNYYLLNENLSYRSGLFYYFIYKDSLNYYKNNKPWKTFKLAFYIQLLAWGLQLLGHKYLENNKPAFFQNLKQSLLIAPLFGYKHLENLILYRTI